MKPSRKRPEIEPVTKNPNQQLGEPKNQEKLEKPGRKTSKETELSRLKEEAKQAMKNRPRVPPKESQIPARTPRMQAETN
ncbi:Hypothetical predicted protein [Olea europaea subsp. europaea]|uniref:Uncharacterized protein n=1 Tax=Olea europaea subsp. europaea TaxID=158383 RepID=A0A8S0PVD8_OLEEU|nr:Hypothetical predicted protein [Olea europaea subsp. europaea]